MSSLKDAFRAFSEETSRLESAYQHLQEDFQTLRSSLEKSTQLTSLICENLTEGLLFINTSGMIELINSSACSLLGCDASVVTKTSFWTHFSDTFFGISMRETLSKNHTAFKVILSIKRKEQSREVEVGLAPIPLKGTVVLLRDLTEQRRLEQAVAHNERLKELGQMAATLAHEIRNPLGGIQGFASLLSSDLKDNQTLRQMAEAIVEGTKVLNQLVTNVLHYARPLEVHLTIVNACDLIAECVTWLEADLSTKAIFQKTLSSPCIILADAALFKGVLLNLLRNALQASPENSTISLSCIQKGGEIEIKIRDEGEGILEEHLPHIFAPFFTTKTQGTGLGLAEAQKVIQAHGGRLSVTLNEQKGVTFIIEVPRYAID